MKNSFKIVQAYSKSTPTCVSLSLLQTAQICFSLFQLAQTCSNLLTASQTCLHLLYPAQTCYLLIKYTYNEQAL